MFVGMHHAILDIQVSQKGGVLQKKLVLLTKMKAINAYLHVILSIALYKVIVTF